jgi:transcription elongation factor Elf1
MNFGMLKNMVENLVSSYTCPFCSWKNISEQNIDIVGAAGNTVNIDMHCPGCDKHFMAKTEVVQMELWSFTADKIEQIKNSLNALKGKMWWDLSVIDAEIEVKNLIKDDIILDLHKDLQQKWYKASDLFSDEI